NGAVLFAHRQQTVRGHAFGFALELERRNWLDLDRVADQPIRGLADERFQGRRRLLQARGDVDGIARNESLARGVIASYDLAGVDPRPIDQPNAPAPV